MTAILFPVGRLVHGSVYQPRTKDYDGNPLVIKKGPNAGQPTQRYDFGVAYAKTEQFWQQTPWGTIIHQEEQASWRNGEYQRRDFSHKIIDGDSLEPNKKGNVPANNPDFRGHWIVNFSSTYPPKLYSADGQQSLVEPNAIKCGYFVQVYGSVASNEVPNNPGMYINHEMVALAGYGPEITTGADASAVGFGQAPLPQGASAVPQGGFNPQGFQPQQPQYNAPAQQPPQYGAPAQQQQQQQYAPNSAPQYAPQQPQYNAPAQQPPQYAPNPAPQHAPQQPPVYNAPNPAPQYAPNPAPGAYAPQQPQQQYAPQGQVQPVPSFINGPQR